MKYLNEIKKDKLSKKTGSRRPAKKIKIIHRGGGEGVTVEDVSVTSNGKFTAPDGKAYKNVTVNVDSVPSYTISLSRDCVDEYEIKKSVADTIFYLTNHSNYDNFPVTDGNYVFHGQILTVGGSSMPSVLPKGKLTFKVNGKPSLILDFVD